MDVKNVVRMNSDDGEFSYAQHARFTRTLNAKTKLILIQAVQSLISSSNSNNIFPNMVFNAADLGCSVGPNPISVVSTIKEAVHTACHHQQHSHPALNGPIKDIQIYLNDLPGNDFNTLFRHLYETLQVEEEEEVDREAAAAEAMKSAKDDPSRFIRCFVAGTPGSFYERLFPKNSLHLVHSCFSVHWLSVEPSGLIDDEGLGVNKGKMYVSETSPPEVTEAYHDQFQQDFHMFLQYRSVEMIPDGRMVLSLHGRQAVDPTTDTNYTWEILSQAACELILQGIIGQEKLDTFNVPYYTPTQEEVQEVVTKEGSFCIEHIETMVIQVHYETSDALANNIRAFTEPLMSYQFGQELMDPFYTIVARLVAEDSTELNIPSVVVVLRKINGVVVQS